MYLGKTLGQFSLISNFSSISVIAFYLNVSEILLVIYDVFPLIFKKYFDSFVFIWIHLAVFFTYFLTSLFTEAVSTQHRHFLFFHVCVSYLSKYISLFSFRSNLFGGANPFLAHKEYLRQVSYFIYILLENKPCVKSVSCVQLFCDPVNCSLPSSSVHGIFQARLPEWVAISSSRGSSQPRDETFLSCVSCIGGGFFTTKPPGKSY